MSASNKPRGAAYEKNMADARLAVRALVENVPKGLDPYEAGSMTFGRALVASLQLLEMKIAIAGGGPTPEDAFEFLAAAVAFRVATGEWVNARLTEIQNSVPNSAKH